MKREIIIRNIMKRRCTLYYATPPAPRGGAAVPPLVPRTAPYGTRGRRTRPTHQDQRNLREDATARPDLARLQLQIPERDTRTSRSATPRHCRAASAIDRARVRRAYFSVFVRRAGQGWRDARPPRRARRRPRAPRDAFTAHWLLNRTRPLRLTVTQGGRRAVEGWARDSHI